MRTLRSSLEKKCKILYLEFLWDIKENKEYIIHYARILNMLLQIYLSCQNKINNKVPQHLDMKLGVQRIKVLLFFCDLWSQLESRLVRATFRLVLLSHYEQIHIFCSSTDDEQPIDFVSVFNVISECKKSEGMGT